MAKQGIAASRTLSQPSPAFLRRTRERTRSYYNAARILPLHKRTSTFLRQMLPACLYIASSPPIKTESPFARFVPGLVFPSPKSSLLPTWVNKGENLCLPVGLVSNAFGLFCAPGIQKPIGEVSGLKPLTMFANQNYYFTANRKHWDWLAFPKTRYI